jgi:hypothetical protein
MIGEVGDRIVIESKEVGQARREGEIVEVIHGQTSVHYRIRWSDGHESVLFPSAGSARVVPAHDTPVTSGARH